MLRLSLFVALLALSACAAPYDPPLAGDHANPKYQSALAKCRKQADLDARRVANASPQAAIVDAFSSAAPERQEILACMETRGYKPQ